MNYRLRALALTLAFSFFIAAPAHAEDTVHPNLLEWVGVAAGMGAVTAVGAGVGAGAGAGAMYGVCPNVGVCQMTDDGKSPSTFFVAIGAVIGGAVGLGIGLFTAGVGTSLLVAE